jgi:hypothetical protein
VVGYNEPAFRLILEAASNPDERGFRNINTLIGKAVPRLAFTNPGFAKSLLAQFTGERRVKIVQTFVYQARHFDGGVFAGSVADYMTSRDREFAAQTASFPDEAELEDLARALRGLP